MFNFVPIYLLSFVVAFCICIPICRGIIPPLRRKAAQPIYEGGPSWHSSKSGTPTLGGISFILAILFSAVITLAILFALGKVEISLSVILIIGYALLNSLVGLFDDLTKLVRKQNAGLTPIQKLILQGILAIAFLFIRHRLLGYDTAITVLDYSIDLGIIYYPAAVFFLLGIINCANLTDGVDGLASGVYSVMSLCMLIISVYSFPDVGIVSALSSGGVLAFLFFNINPAKIFMGDTGSLFLGALAASIVFSFGNPFLSLLFCGVYVIEGFSVVIQVISYKVRKKRIFLMSPIHHHLEKIGWNESKICMCAILLTVVLSVPAYLLI